MVSQMTLMLNQVFLASHWLGFSLSFTSKQKPWQMVPESRLQKNTSA